MADTTTDSTQMPVDPKTATATTTDPNKPAVVATGAVAENPGQIAPIGSKAQTDAAAANVAAMPAPVAPKMADTVRAGDGTGKADQSSVTADVIKTIDAQNANANAAAGQAQVQLAADLEATNGYHGTKTDPTPNKNYTFAGQALGLGTPETHPEYAKAIGSNRFSHYGELDGTTADGNFDSSKQESDAKSRSAKK